MERTLTLFAALALALRLAAQGQPAPPPAVPTPDGPPAPSVAVPGPADRPASIEEILAIHTTPYHPALQRDPFAAPSDAEQNHRGDLIDDIAVKGRVVSAGKAKAVVTDSRGNTRMLPIGYKFRDGVLVAVDDRSATFHQWDASGTNTKIYRTVVKVYKREEAKR